MLRSLSPKLKSSSRLTLGRLQQQSQRSIYTVPEIENLDEFKAEGIPGLYSAKGLQQAWYSRAQYHVNNLNQSQPNENAISESLEYIVSKFHGEPKKKSLYENASLLYNMKFSLETLAPINDAEKKAKLPERANVKSLLKTPSLEYKFPNEPLNKKLNKWLTDSFGSINQFRTLFLNSAEAIKGDGFVWLVTQAIEGREVTYQDLFVLNTYNCGQPNNNIAASLDNLKIVNQRLESLKKKKQQEEAGEVVDEEQQRPTRTFAYESALFKNLDEAKDAFYRKKPVILPLLAIDASPKAYLHDYGVFGKRNYLERVWECIDWDKVASRLPERQAKIQY